MLRDRTVSDRVSLLAVCCSKSQFMYEYIIETETPLSELKTFPNYKETCAFTKASVLSVNNLIQTNGSVRYQNLDHIILILHCTLVHCVPGRKSGILRIRYGHATAAAEISFWR